jgi:hypothetical protein
MPTEFLAAFQQHRVPVVSAQQEARNNFDLVMTITAKDRIQFILAVVGERLNAVLRSPGLN